ncbi:MAG: hypothetical protein MJ054_02125 [Clostridia bacterium]|nr:hypothetical protein [Clostridia bacterium]
MCIAGLCGYSEVAVILLMGIVAFNWCLLGLLSLIFNVSVPREKRVALLLWLTITVLVYLLGSLVGHLGRFSGCGLIIAGAVALWQLQSQLKITQLSWHKVILLLVVLLLTGLGTWLLVRYHAVMAVMLNTSITVLGCVVIAPLLGVMALFLLRKKRLWQPEKLVHSIYLLNIFLSTFGLGIVSLISNSVYLSKSLVTLILPWVAVVTVLGIIGIFLPKKTARWWGGLIIVMYVGLIFNLSF